MSLDIFLLFSLLFLLKVNFLKTAPICQVHCMVKKCTESYKKKPPLFLEAIGRDLLRTKKLPQNSSNSDSIFFSPVKLPGSGCSLELFLITSFSYKQKMLLRTREFAMVATSNITVALLVTAQLYCGSAVLALPWHWWKFIWLLLVTVI